MDSGVVIRISAGGRGERGRSLGGGGAGGGGGGGVVEGEAGGGGWRAKRARSLAGVSPVRMAMVGSWKAMPAERAACAMPTSGERRLRSISTARALMGEM